jgi:hypothetical protein
MFEHLREFREQFLTSGLLATLFSIVHCVRFGSKPVLTDHTQFLTLLSQANSTASFGLLVASTMIGITLSVSQ